MGRTFYKPLLSWYDFTAQAVLLPRTRTLSFYFLIGHSPKKLITEIFKDLRSFCLSENLVDFVFQRICGERLDDVCIDAGLSRINDLLTLPRRRVVMGILLVIIAARLLARAL